MTVYDDFKALCLMKVFLSVFLKITYKKFFLYIYIQCLPGDIHQHNNFVCRVQRQTCYNTSTSPICRSFALWGQRRKHDETFKRWAKVRQSHNCIVFLEFLSGVPRSENTTWHKSATIRNWWTNMLLSNVLRVPFSLLYIMNIEMPQWQNKNKNVYYLKVSFSL
jgi:hypothetical protein